MTLKRWMDFGVTLRWSLVPLLVLILAVIAWPGTSIYATQSLGSSGAASTTLTLAAFGADPTGRQPADGSLRAAIDLAVQSGNRAIHVPTGTYRIDGTIIIPAGIMIVGDGSQGSNDSRGTVFKHYSTGDCFIWNGSGPAYAGTGGGLKDALIVKADGYQGGTAVRLVATDDDHRPGEMLFENVLVYGVGSQAGKGGIGGLWSHGLVIDGTAAHTPGARGVRSIHLVKVRFAESTVPGETVVLEGATHFFATGLQIDQGDARSSQGITLRGVNDGVFFNGADIGGSVVIVDPGGGNATRNFMLTGKIGGVFDNRDPKVNGTISASFDTDGRYVLLNRSKSLRISSNIDPDFTVSAASMQPGVTGDGTIYTVAFDRKDRDVGNNFGQMPVTDFTAATAGTYLITASITLANLSAANRHLDMSIDQVGSVIRSFPLTLNPAALATGGIVTVEKTAVVSLAAGDRVKAVVAVSGGNRTVAVYGTVSAYTSLSGHYLD